MLARQALENRARYLEKIRAYFKQYDVLEVDTPLAYPYPVSDPYIDAFAIETQAGARYLQTSPEYAMKRLLAAGSGSIYQICKAFRNDPKSKLHNHEFTMLEWYRVGLDHHALIKEITVLLKQLKPDASILYFSYQEIFSDILHINPHTLSLDELQKLVIENIGEVSGLKPNVNYYLDLLFSHCIEPVLKQKQAFVFIYHYPYTQAALAKIIEDNGQQVAARFELFYQGVELANGYDELTDHNEQKQRFLSDLEQRKKEAKASVPLDLTLLESMCTLPACAGVALGLDRLIMCLEGYQNISDVLICC